MKIRIVFLGLAALLAFYSFACAQTEQLTLTTYYPSPLGTYSELQLFPKPEAGAVCSAANDEGKMYYNSTLHSMRVCKNVSSGGSAVYQWSDSGNWTVSDDNVKLYTNNDAWNVGIGTSTPAYKLQVEASGSNAILALKRKGATTPSGGIYSYGTNPVGIYTYGSALKMYDGGFEFWTDTLPQNTDDDRDKTVIITNDGNVGIGNDLAAASIKKKLEVYGDIKISDTGKVFMGYEIIMAEANWNVTAYCSSAAKRIIGGGCDSVGSTGYLYHSYPVTAGGPSLEDGWRCLHSKDGKAVRAYAICARIDK